MTTEDHGGVAERGRIIALGDGGPHLQIVPTEAGVTAWVEGSVPKFATGSNFPAATVGEASEVAREWVALAGSVVEFEDTRDLRVNRLDVVRDFDVGDPQTVGELLVAHASVPVDGRKAKAAFEDASRGHARTVAVRTRFSGSGRLYDKAKESREALAARGVLRFEAMERKRSLARAGAELLGDLDSAVLAALGRQRFEWCGFDRPVVTWERFRDRVLGDDRRRWSTKLQLLGYAELMRSEGAVPAAPDRKADWRIRSRLREYGYAVGAGEAAFLDRFRGAARLDYSEGLVAA